MRQVIVVIVAVVALAAGAIYLARPKGSGPDPKAWDAKAAAAFRTLVSDVPDLVTASREWQAGDRSTEQFRLVVDHDRADFARTLTRVSDLRPSPKVPATGELYQRSAQLYVEVARTYQAMIATPPGDLRGQLDLLARRVRELADRVFDRGQAAIAPYLDNSKSKDIDIRLPEEVPIWPDEGLAAGPPLDDQPAPRASSPPLRRESRPQEPEEAWLNDVRAAKAPTGSALNEAIRGGDAGALQAIGRQFVAAAEQLRGKPDPRGGREKGAIVRLAFLIDADAARSGQAATFVTGSARRTLETQATALAGVATDLQHQAGV